MECGLGRTDQERFFKFDGKQLHVISQWIRSATYDNRMSALI